MTIMITADSTIKMVKTTILGMVITMATTTTKSVTRTSTVTIPNTAPSALASGITVPFQVFAKSTNTTIVPNFLISHNRNPMSAITILSLAFLISSIKTVKTTIPGMVITMATTTTKSVTSQDKCNHHSDHLCN